MSGPLGSIALLTNDGGGSDQLEANARSQGGRLFTEALYAGGCPCCSEEYLASQKRIGGCSADQVIEALG